jgi:hypothetical protein
MYYSLKIIVFLHLLFNFLEKFYPLEQNHQNDSVNWLLQIIYLFLNKEEIVQFEYVVKSVQNV